MIQPTAERAEERSIKTDTYARLGIAEGRKPIGAGREEEEADRRRAAPASVLCRRAWKAGRRAAGRIAGKPHVSAAAPAAR